MEGVCLTPALTRMVGHVGALVSLAERSDLLHELSAALVDAKQVERTADWLEGQRGQVERGNGVTH